MEWYQIILIIIVLGLRVYAYSTGNTEYIKRQRRRRRNKQRIGIWGTLIGLALLGLSFLFNLCST